MRLSSLLSSHWQRLGNLPRMLERPYLMQQKAPTEFFFSDVVSRLLSVIIIITTSITLIIITRT